MDIKTTTLPNGLRIITANRPHTESVSLGFWVRSGSASEKKEENGISHFIEHMVFKGTKTRTSRQISEEIENVGGQNNAYTSREITSFYARVLKDDIKVAFDLISDLILNPTFPEDEMKKEKEVVIQEIKQNKDIPDDLIFDFFQECAYPDQPLGRTILGPEENVRAMNAAQMFDFMKNHYAAENIVLAAAGNIDHDTLAKMAAEKFSDFRAKKNFQIVPAKYVGGCNITKKDIEQTHMMLGFEGIGHGDPMFFQIMTLSTLFGGGMSSRLFQEIREKLGLVYSIYSFSNSHFGTGLFGIYAATDADGLCKMMPVLSDEIKKIQNDLVSAEELKRAKAQLKAGIFMSLESSSVAAEMIARHNLVFGRLIPSEEIIEKIEAISAEDIRNAAQYIFASNPTYTLLGNMHTYPEYDELKKILKS